MRRETVDIEQACDAIANAIHYHALQVTQWSEYGITPEDLANVPRHTQAVESLSVAYAALVSTEDATDLVRAAYARASRCVHGE